VPVVTHAKLGKVSEPVKDFAGDLFCGQLLGDCFWNPRFRSRLLARFALAAAAFDAGQGSEARIGYRPAVAELPVIDVNAAKTLSLALETQFADNGIVSRTLLRTNQGRVVLFGFAEGQELTEHTSTQHVLVQVLSGECDFSLAGRPQVLKAGDLLYMPPSLPHALKARTRFSMLLTLFKA
jgi:quercetin dioxygenase-like cupin family protein